MIDPDFTADTELRLLKLEKAMTSIWRLLRTAVNKEQLNRLTVISQKTHDAHDTRITALETSVQELQNLFDQLM